jgi:hypothetical protein
MRHCEHLTPLRGDQSRKNTDAASEIVRIDPTIEMLEKLIGRFCLS